MYTARHAVQVATYLSGCPQYSSLGSFLNLVLGDFVGEFTVESALLTLHEAIDRNGCFNNDIALTCLVKEECLRLCEYLDFNKSSVAEIFALESDPIDSLNQACDLAVKELSSYGIAIERPDIHVVECFPRPFHDRLFFALNIDKGDHVTYGIQEGIYFKSEFLRPIYSRYLLLHELVHTVLGQRSPDLLARGLEEGLCELVGSFFLSEKIFGLSATKTLFVLNRLAQANNSGTGLYLDYTRQAAEVLFVEGWDFIFDLLKKGRLEIKKVEQELWSGQFYKVKETSIPFSDLDAVVRQLVFVASSGLVASPLACYLSRFVSQGDTVIELSKKSNICPDECLIGLEELENKFSYVALRDDKIVVSFSDCCNIVRPLGLRYSF